MHVQISRYTSEQAAEDLYNLDTTVGMHAKGSC